MGVDPASKNSIDYAIQNKTYSQNFFEIVLKPLSNLGMLLVHDCYLLLTI